jgi:hypothetical protein
MWAILSYILCFCVGFFSNSFDIYMAEDQRIRLSGYQILDFLVIGLWLLVIICEANCWVVRDLLKDW